jgi:hypothetical protein
MDIKDLRLVSVGVFKEKIKMDKLGIHNVNGNPN